MKEKEESKWSRTSHFIPSNIRISANLLHFRHTPNSTSQKLAFRFWKKIHGKKQKLIIWRGTDEISAKSINLDDQIEFMSIRQIECFHFFFRLNCPVKWNLQQTNRKQKQHKLNNKVLKTTWFARILAVKN